MLTVSRKTLVRKGYGQAPPVQTEQARGQVLQIPTEAPRSCTGTIQFPPQML